jgi:hypothetical protein
MWYFFKAWVQQIFMPAKLVPAMSADEINRMNDFIQTTFPKSKWNSKKNKLYRYICQLESSLRHGTIYGADGLFRFNCGIGMDDRGGHGVRTFPRDLL